MNMHSTPLQKGEAKLMRQDINIAKRFIKSYRMMLDFYGIVILVTECSLMLQEWNY